RPLVSSCRARAICLVPPLASWPKPCCLFLHPAILDCELCRGGTGRQNFEDCSKLHLAVGFDSGTPIRRGCLVNWSLMKSQAVNDARAQSPTFLRISASRPSGGNPVRFAYHLPRYRRICRGR